MLNHCEINLFNGDCLEIMPQLEEKSFDLILADPPYGITACEWDSIIPFPKMWENIKRVLKPGGTVALSGSQPFTSKLVMSNLEWFKYEAIWLKSSGTGFLHAKNAPIKSHENIIFFSEAKIGHANLLDNRMKYNPQGIKKSKTKRHSHKSNAKSEHRIFRKKMIENSSYNDFTNYPKSFFYIQNGNFEGRGAHPTAKPIPLNELIIRTYTDPGDQVLDFCMGSGSTGVACQNTGRHFTGIEIEEKYYRIAQQRMKENNRLLVF